MSEEELLNRLNTELSFITSLNNPTVEQLFRDVDNYVKSNYICDIEDDKYYIKYNGKYYVSGFYVGPEILYYVRITRDKHIKEYVDFEDMKNNRLNPVQQEVKNKIDEINDNITLLESKGISRKLIKKSIHI